MMGCEAHELHASAKIPKVIITLMMNLLPQAKIRAMNLSLVVAKGPLPLFFQSLLCSAQIQLRRVQSTTPIKGYTTLSQFLNF